MKRLGFALVLSALAGCAVLGAPEVRWAGDLSLELPGFAWNSESYWIVGVRDEVWQASIAGAVRDGAWEPLTADVAALLSEAQLGLLVEFAPQTPSFAAAEFATSFDWEGVEVSGVVRSEPGALGAGLTLTRAGDSVLQRVEILWNLDPFLGTVQTTSCCPTFSSAAASFRLPLPWTLEPLLVDLDSTEGGFSEAVLRFGPTPEVLPGIRFSGTTTFSLEEKRLAITPSLSLPAAGRVTLYLELDWDDNAQRLYGVSFHGLSLGCEIGGVRLRSLTAFDPDHLALVKAPYWELFGVIWEIPGCCGPPGEGSVALYFGDAGLFDLEEIEVEVLIPLAPGFTLSGNLVLGTAGTYILGLGWEAALPLK